MKAETDKIRKLNDEIELLQLSVKEMINETEGTALNDALVYCLVKLVKKLENKIHAIRRGETE